MSSKLFRLNAGETLPAGIVTALREAGMTAAWIRAGGVIADAEIRTLRADGSVMDRRFSGPAQLVSLEGALGARSEAGLGVVLARETERGLETMAGTLVRARVVLIEGIAIELETGANTRTAAETARDVPPSPVVTPQVAVPVTHPHAAPAQANASAPMPQRPARPPESDVPDAPFPDAGDVVEHFAFGTCDVLKSDGDRIHLRVHRDQRIKEIAPEMLKVVPLDLTSSPRRFRLERKL